MVLPALPSANHLLIERKERGQFVPFWRRGKPPCRDPGLRQSCVRREYLQNQNSAGFPQIYALFRIASSFLSSSPPTPCRSLSVRSLPTWAAWAGGRVPHLGGLKGTTRPQIRLDCKPSGWTVMRLISRLLGTVVLLCIAISAEAATRDRADVEYPAAVFAPVREAEKGVGQRFEREDGRAVLSIYARESEDDDTPASYLRKTDNPCLSTNGSAGLSLRSQWNEMGQFFIADATSLLAVPPYIVSTWCIHKAKKRPGTL